MKTKAIRELRKSHGLDQDREWDIWRDGCEDGEYVPVSLKSLPFFFYFLSLKNKFLRTDSTNPSPPNPIEPPPKSPPASTPSSHKSSSCRLHT